MLLSSGACVFALSLLSEMALDTSFKLIADSVHGMNVLWFHRTLFSRFSDGYRGVSGIPVTGRLNCSYGNF